MTPSRRSSSGEGALTREAVLADPETRRLIDMADHYLDVIGYTNHGLPHVQRVSDNAQRIILGLGLAERDAELAGIAGLMHDIGNVIHRNDHAKISAILSFDILRRLQMPLEEIAVIAGAIGNHDESDGDPVSVPSAALIIADKCDVIRSRVRNKNMIHWDIHDRVNYAVERSNIQVEREAHVITLELEIDTAISQIMEYFEIFLDRMKISRRAANYLNCDFRLVMNGTTLS
ncbi:MAG: HD domain-containing protein [Candidatus Sumerlaeota bacterium]|nr:HD domain-containing protein [Candidatus Sumerlaeota bacterium]